MPSFATIGLWLACCNPAAQAPDGAVARPSLTVSLPEARPAARAALRVAAAIAAEHAAALDIDLSWVSQTARAAAGGAAIDGVRQSVDGDAAGRADFAVGWPVEDAVAIWRGADGELLLVERFDEGARHWAADLARGRPPLDWRPLVAAIDGAQGVLATRTALRRAVRVLAGRPEHLARAYAAAVARQPVIAGDDQVRLALASAFAASPRCEAVQHALFRVAVAAADQATARRAGLSWIESVRGRPIAARRMLAAIIAAGAALEEATGADLDDVLDLAFPITAAAAPGDRVVLQGWFEHLVLERGDTILAERVGLRLVAAIGADATALNAFAWSLLTREPYAGRLDRLALAAAEAMAADPGWRSYWRVDTLALACFRNGRVRDAIELQHEAVAGADRASRRRYVERLEDYELALFSAPGR